MAHWPLAMAPSFGLRRSCSPRSSPKGRCTRRDFRSATSARQSTGSRARAWGFSILNPIRTRIEDSYIAERITIPLDGAVAGAKQAMSSRLEANGTVSISLVPRGARCIEFPFHEGWLRMALGAPSFALRTSAALLPVFTVCKGSSRFVTTIEPALISPSRP
jgi:hypothetical protein